MKCEHDTGSKKPKMRESRYHGLVVNFGPFGHAVRAYADNARYTPFAKANRAMSRDGMVVERDALRQPMFFISIVGMMMEDAKELLKATNEEVENSQRILEELQNKVRSLADGCFA